MKRWTVRIEVEVISDVAPSLNHAVYALRKVNTPHFMADWDTLRVEAETKA